MNKQEDCCHDDSCKESYKESCKDCHCNSSEKETKSSCKESQNQDSDLKKQYSDIKETLQRVYAEFQNYKKRTDEERQRFMELSNEEFIKKMLPILDNIELALMHKKCDDDFSKGIELIYAQFVQTLEDEGVKIILSSGKFDPKLHEVLMTENSNKEEGVILEEFQKGYVLGGKVLRHAKVKIAKHAKKEE